MKICIKRIALLLMAVSVMLAAGPSYAEESGGTYKITVVNAFAASLEVVVSGSNDTTHFNVFKRATHTLVNPVPVSLDRSITALPMMYVNTSDLIIRTYSDPAGENLTGEFALDGKGQLVPIAPVSQADCDLNGRVNLRDLTLLALAYGSTSANVEGRWNLQCDLNGDDQVTLMDLVLLARYYGQ